MAGRIIARNFRINNLKDMLHSLTYKNLGIFLIAFLVSLVPLVASHWMDSRQSRIAGLGMQLEVVANRCVQDIDTFTYMVLTERRLHNSPEHQALVEVLKKVEKEFHMDNAVVLRKAPNGEFYYVADGKNQFFLTQPAALHQRFSESKRAANQAWNTGQPVHTELFGFGTYEYLQLYTPIMFNGKVVGLLLINKFAEDVDQAINMKIFSLLLLAVGLALLGSLGFWLFSRRMLAPLMGLNEAANRLAKGDLDVAIPVVKRRDEVATLNESFRAMVEELRLSRAELKENNDELTAALAKVRMMEVVEKNLSAFVPREVRKALNTDPSSLEKGKTEKDVTVLFLDIEGSSKLTESLDPRRLDDLIEVYFSRYLDTIYVNQGDITETAGDGLMIIFQGDEPAQHAMNAARTARAISAITEEVAAEQSRSDPIKINIGINSGKALVGFTRYESVGGDRMTFTASGRTTIVAARLEDLATGGSIYLSEETQNRVVERSKVEGELGELKSVGKLKLKNISEPEQVYKLIPNRRKKPR